MSWLSFSLYFLIKTTDSLIVILCREQLTLFCVAAKEPRGGGGATGGRYRRIDLVAETQQKDFDFIWEGACCRSLHFLGSLHSLAVTGTSWSQ